MTTNEVRNAWLIEVYQAKGLKMFRNNVGVVRPRDDSDQTYSFGLKASVDYVGYCTPHGSFVAVEIKGDGDRLTSKQERFLANVNASGGIGCVVDSSNVKGWAEWFNKAREST